MKHLLRLLILSALSFTLVGCDSGSDSGPEVTKVLCIGDSITAGLGAVPYPSIMAGILGKPVVNEGKNGRLSAEGVALIRQLITRHQPSHVVILLGTNDAITGTSQFGAGQNIQAMVDIAKELGVKPVIGTLPPITRSKPENDRSRTISGYIKDVKGAKLADIRKEFGEESPLLFDGVHPNNDGQNIIAMAFAEKLK